MNYIERNAVKSNSRFQHKITSTKNRKLSTINILKNVGKHIFIISFLIVTLFPFIWATFTSFKLPNEILTYPPTIFPKDFTLDNYFSILIKGKFIRYTFNSIFVTLLSVIISLLAALFAGYAASRYIFPGKMIIMFFMLAGMAIGKFANVIPLYFFATEMNLFDTYTILILSSSAMVVPLLAWLMHGYFESIPKALDDSAKIDGCNSWGTFWRILLPAMKPAIVAGAVIAMVNAWNEFILAMTLTRSPELRILPVAINFFKSDTGVDWGQLTAASIIATIPIVIVVVILQKHFISGLTTGSID